MTCPVSDKPDRIVKAYTLEEQKKIEEIAANHKTPYGRVNYKHQVFYDDMNTKSINLLEKYFLEEDSEEE